MLWRANLWTSSPLSESSRYIKRNPRFCCKSWVLLLLSTLLMFSFLAPRSRHGVTALVPRIPSRSSATATASYRTFPRTSRSNFPFHQLIFCRHQETQHLSSLWKLDAKRSNSAGFVRQASLVVHGPPDVVENKKGKGSSRPFQLVIVESPSKCATISKILQDYVKTNNLEYDFVVTSCMGHIRNIPQQKSSKEQKVAGIDLEGGKYQPTYTILPDKEILVSDLKDWSDRAQKLVLATDDDREGEAMAWHLLQVLEPPSDFIRVRFTEITPKAILESITQHAEVNSLRYNLVQAQETRRVLDRLAGFTVSPILWKKIAPGLSAGRVQSVGMALIVQRERERLLFQETEYWDAQAEFSALSETFTGHLVAVNDQPLANRGADFEARKSGQLTVASKDKLHWKKTDTEQLMKRLDTDGWTWRVEEVTARERKLNPSPPFITSTLQQDANKRLALSVSRTMQSAQQLYEKGFISYMRTDSDHLSDDAKNAIRAEIEADFGPDFYQQATAKSKRKRKGGKPDPQAAHEAIRPAIQPDGGFIKPKDLREKFDDATKQLYTLIYQRTVASHMPPQVSKSTSIRIIGENDSDETTLTVRASGSVVVKPGFSMVYPSKSEKSPLLPNLKDGQIINCDEVVPLQHFSQPPPRYTEASFVQELESLGIGRPSTYAGTVKILRDRAYVGSPVTSDSGSRGGRGQPLSGSAISAQRAAGGEEFTGSRSAKGPMVPSLSAFVVCSLLENHCNMYVDPSFTARMEERLDMIANAEEVSEEERVAYLDEFYSGDEGLAAQIQRINEEVDADDARRANLPALEWNSTNGSDEIGLFVGPWGPYVKRIARDENGVPVAPVNGEKKQPSAPLPPGMSADLSLITLQTLDRVLATKEVHGSILGQHPEDGRNIRLKVGRFGAYLQWGDDNEKGTSTHTLPRELRNLKNVDLDGSSSDDTMLGVSYEDAVKYVNLPRTVCTIDDKPIVAAIGPYGPYLKYDNKYHNLKAAEGDVVTIDAERAEEIVVENIINRKEKPRAGVLANLGEKEGSAVSVKEGRFGIYINWKQVNAKMPADYLDKPSDLPLEEAWALIQEKASSSTRKSNKGKKKKSASVELPPGPKRPLSAYLHFCAEKRPEVSSRVTRLGDISKELARLWAETSEKDRQPYVGLAEKGKIAYEEAKKEWTKECQAVLDKTGAPPSARTSKIKGGPKRPKTAYLFFSADKREDASKSFKKLGDVSKELARRWAETTDEERKPFDEMATADKERYEKEKTGLPAGDSVSTSARTPAKKSRKGALKKKKTAASTPKKKRGPSAYMLFCAAHRSEIVDENGKKLPLGETTKRLAKMWNECGEDTKSQFMAEAERRKELVV